MEAIKGCKGRTRSRNRKSWRFRHGGIRREKEKRKGIGCDEDRMGRKGREEEEDNEDWAGDIEKRKWMNGKEKGRKKEGFV